SHSRATFVRFSLCSCCHRQPLLLLELSSFASMSFIFPLLSLDLFMLYVCNSYAVASNLPSSIQFLLYQ
ncbi:hypothetical protein S245_069938, partial [Arachis hypogaea]